MASKGQVSSVVATREERLREALFHGHKLTLDNPQYVRTLEAIVGTLLSEDREPEDLTVSALSAGLRLEHSRRGARIMAKQSGIAAGLQEAVWLAEHGGAKAKALAADGDKLHNGDALIEMHGPARTLLSLERVCLNLLQRMCGIASTTRRWQKIAAGQSRTARLVATRKTPWGLLDKRAVHCGGGGTHRLGLHDAILIKNNHLALLDPDESAAVPLALDLAWTRREGAAFIEVEVRSLDAAQVAARAFARLQDSAPPSPPCIILLDNMTPAETGRVVASLSAQSLWDHVLTEASGNIAEEAIAEYAASGVDAISAGALTHSVRAMDLNQKIV